MAVYSHCLIINHFPPHISLIMMRLLFFKVVIQKNVLLASTRVRLGTKRSTHSFGLTREASPYSSFFTLSFLSISHKHFYYILSQMSINVKLVNVTSKNNHNIPMFYLSIDMFLNSKHGFI